MAVRVFTCRRCGHRMRLSGPACGACSIEKPLWQRPLALLGAVLAAGAGAVIAASLGVI